MISVRTLLSKEFKVKTVKKMKRVKQYELLDLVVLLELNSRRILHWSGRLINALSISWGIMKSVRMTLK